MAINYLDVAGDKGLAALTLGLGLATTLTLLDDKNLGANDASFLANLDDVCKRASGEADARLAGSFVGNWPTAVNPATGKYAERILEGTLEMAISKAYARKPEFTRQISGDGPLLSVWHRKQAIEIFTEVANGRQNIVEAIPNKGTLLNGGIVVGAGQRMTISDADGTDNSGDFG